MSLVHEYLCAKIRFHSIVQSYKFQSFKFHLLKGWSQAKSEFDGWTAADILGRNPTLAGEMYSLNPH